MNPVRDDNFSALGPVLAGVLLLITANGAQAQAWRAAASTDIVACGVQDVASQGGGGDVRAVVTDSARRVCDAQSANATAAAAASIAAGFAVATANGTSLAAGDLVIARSDFADIVRIIGVPAAQNEVTARVTLTFVADGDTDFFAGTNFLFNRITVPGAGDFELRRCGAQTCPTEPISSETFTEVITVPRLGGTGEFGAIGVAASVTIQTDGPAARLYSAAHIELLDAPGAMLTSESGAYGTQLPSDEDADGIPDVVDNCVAVANTAQRDSDGDGFGNRCDPDLNNDGQVNVVDLGLLRAVVFTDDADADLDGDGTVNMKDVGLMRAFFFAAPGPSFD